MSDLRGSPRWAKPGAGADRQDSPMNEGESREQNGKANPSVEVAKKIAAVLDFDWVKFFEDEHAATNEICDN